MSWPMIIFAIISFAWLLHVSFYPEWWIKHFVLTDKSFARMREKYKKDKEE